MENAATTTHRDKKMNRRERDKCWTGLGNTREAEETGKGCVPRDMHDDNNRLEGAVFTTVSQVSSRFERNEKGGFHSEHPRMHVSGSPGESRG